MWQDPICKGLQSSCRSVRIASSAAPWTTQLVFMCGYSA